MNYRYPSRPRGARRYAAAGVLLLALVAILCAPAGVASTRVDRHFTAPAGHDWYQVLVDPGARLTFAEVGPGGDAQGFEPASEEALNRGFTRAAIWARFELRYAASDAPPLVLVLPRPLLDHVELYRVVPGGGVQVQRTGDAEPFDSRGLPYRAFAFELPPRPGQSVTYFVRVSGSTSASGLPLRLMTSAGFRELAQREDFFIGAYFGVVGGLAIAAVLLFATLRERIFLSYFLYVSAFALTVAAASGYGMQVLWPRQPDWQQVLPTVFVALTLIAGVAFVRRFLLLAERWRGVDRAFVVIGGVGVAGALVALTTGIQAGTVTLLASAVALCPLALLAGIRCVLAGDRVARYFLVGWVVCMTGIIAAGLDMLGFIPGNVCSAYGLYFGSLAEFVALSVALGDRVRHLQREKDEEIARTNAELAELNQNLEHIVRDRTHELEQRNRELGELAIRDSLTGLYNHSTTIELLDQVLNQSQRYEFAVTVLMIDIDHFKRINDSYGHQVGDAVLEIVSQTLADTLRDSDIVGRYGGEEFLVVMPHAEAQAAREFGERLIGRVREIAVPRSGGEHLGISVGISVSNPHGARLAAAEMIKRADEALYRSKREGRNRLTIDSLSLVSASAAERHGVPRVGQ